MIKILMENIYTALGGKSKHPLITQQQIIVEEVTGPNDSK